MHVTFVGYSWNNQGIYLYLIFSDTLWEYYLEFHRDLFPNILGIYHGNVARIFREQYSRNINWKYSAESHRELFPNILEMYHGNVTRIFHKHIFARWIVSKADCDLWFIFDLQIFIKGIKIIHDIWIKIIRNIKHLKFSGNS